MVGYTVRRLFLMLLNLILVTFFVFFMLRLIPGDVATSVLGQFASDEQYALFRERHGLNDSLPEQYARWAFGLLQGNLGQSLVSNFNVTSDFVRYVPVTLEIVLLSFVFTTAIGITFGTVSAVLQDTKWDYAVRLMSVVGLAVPSFLLLTILLVVPSRLFAYSPPFGANQFLDHPWDNLRLFVPPALMLSFGSAAGLMRITRTAFLNVLRQDYMRTARAKGLNSHTIILRHGMRNVLGPIATVAGIHLGNLLGGSVIVESVMGLPGLGTWALNAIQSKDFPVVMAFSLYVALVIMTISLMVDLLYAVFDPRIRLK